MAMPKSTPARPPLSFSSSGLSRPATVPGGTVLRKTTTANSSAARNARPISIETFSTCARSTVPSLRAGVPTQTMITSDRATAPSRLVVTESLSDDRAAEMSSAS